MGKNLRSTWSRDLSDNFPLYLQPDNSETLGDITRNRLVYTYTNRGSGIFSDPKIPPNVGQSSTSGSFWAEELIAIYGLLKIYTAWYRGKKYCIKILTAILGTTKNQYSLWDKIAHGQRFNSKLCIYSFTSGRTFRIFYFLFWNRLSGV